MNMLIQFVEGMERKEKKKPEKEWIKVNQAIYYTSQYCRAKRQGKKP